ncbi:hypothetical protein L6164_014275 [Bauhinia variegata]|uniref:Uncharacterized protein n=1 Tax=Bauhinia variegata TaxID=167791 RepID=A0ACB9NHZ3_BAUVA|nr:hypothetical protein L6164_014275 [Bauhinia variegata]
MSRACVVAHLKVALVLMLVSIGAEMVESDPQIPLPPIFRQDPDLMRCLGTLVRGCLQEVITAFLSVRVELVGPECCKAFIQVDKQCWPKVFPINPFFPPLLKSYCANKVATPSPPQL